MNCVSCKNIIGYEEAATSTCHLEAFIELPYGCLCESCVKIVSESIKDALNI